MAKKPTKRQVKKVVKEAEKHPVAAIIIIILIVIILGIGAVLYMNGFFDKFLNNSGSGTVTTTAVIGDTTTTKKTTGPTKTYDPESTRTWLTDYVEYSYNDGVYANSAIFPDGFTPVECADGIIENVIYNNFEIHFMERGVYNAGDATYIKAGDTDILIDAGAAQASATTLEAYIDKYCTDGILEYVIATHSDQDHIAGFVGTSDSKAKNVDGEVVGRTGIFYYYNVGTIIDFAQNTKSETTAKGNSTLYGNYLEARDYAVSKGATHYTAAECFNNENGAQSTYYLSDTLNITMNILYNKYYFEESSDENNHSVCTLFTYNDLNFLMTGDLEIEGEEAMAAYYDGSTEEKTLPEVELFKAGHHGSKTSSNECLLSIVKPKICVACCCAGSTEYTVDCDNIFPTQDFITRIAKYTDRVYVTTIFDEEKTMETGTYTFESMNGDITVSSNGKYVGLYASNNLTKLKDTEWFNATVYVDKDGHIASGAKGSKVFYKAGDVDDKDGTTQVTSRKRRTWPTA